MFIGVPEDRQQSAATCWIVELLNYEKWFCARIVQPNATKGGLMGTRPIE